MYKEKKILGLIPARGGSKGVPRKNVKPLGRWPLLAWTIHAAKQSTLIDRLILSSEDPEIMAVAREYGCEVPFVRPPDLAEDDTPGIAPVLHAVAALEETFDYLVLLQPTSPFRKAEDVDGAIRRCIDQGADYCVSVTESAKHPAWMFHLTKDGGLVPVVELAKDVANRQQLEPAYALNGAVYVVRISALLQQKAMFDPKGTLAYAMPPERSIDIDSSFDFSLCELMAREMEETDVF